MNYKYALITGAGTGIGRCYALNLAVRGCNLILAGNVGADLESVKAEILGNNPKLVVETITIDLARREASEELFERSKAIADVDILINNAGIFSFLDMVDTPMSRIENIVLLHDLTLTKNCRLFAEDMIKRGVKGHILNMSSFSIWMPLPGLALYSASKAYVRSFSVAFAEEVGAKGVKVTAICPAGVATNLYGLPSNLQKLGCKLGALITPNNCAKRALKAMFRGRKCVVPDWWNRLFIPMFVLMPRCVVKQIHKRTKQFQS